MNEIVIEITVSRQHDYSQRLSMTEKIQVKGELTIVTMAKLLQGIKESLPEKI